MNKEIYPCLWFDGQAKAAAEFYCSVFSDSRITSENPLVVMLEIRGKKFMALNGGPEFKFNEALSFVVDCDTQEEIDAYWTKLIADGGAESMCGWCKDKFGLWWQIVPSNVGELVGDPARRERVMKVLMQMRKLDIEKLMSA